MFKVVRWNKTNLFIASNIFETQTTTTWVLRACLKTDAKFSFVSDITFWCVKALTLVFPILDCQQTFWAISPDPFYKYLKSSKKWNYCGTRRLEYKGMPSSQTKSILPLAGLQEQRSVPLNRFRPPAVQKCLTTIARLAASTRRVAVRSDRFNLNCLYKIRA